MIFDNLHPRGCVHREKSYFFASTLMYRAFPSHACFLPTGFRLPATGIVKNAQKTVRRPTYKVAHHVSLNTAFISGGNNGAITRHYRRENGWDDESSPITHSVVTVFGSRQWRGAQLFASSRYGQSKNVDPWFSKLKVTDALILFSLLIFALQFASGGTLVAAGAKVNSAIAAGEWHRLFSPIFLHASVSHLVINMYSLHSTGSNVESWFGKKRFLALYAFSGFTGNVLSFLCSPAPSVGASGAIFGLVGALFVALSRHRSILHPNSRSTLWTIGFVVLINFGIGMSPGAQIDNYGHLGGLLGGLLFGYVAGPRLSRRRTIAGNTVIEDRPLYLDVMAETHLRMRQLLSLFK